MGPHSAGAGAGQSVSYSRLNESVTSVKFDDSSNVPLVEQSGRYTRNRFGSSMDHVVRTLRLSFQSLESCPKELYINFVLKFFESYSYFAISQILVIYLHTEFAVSDIEAGVAYGTWGLAITLWGLSTAWMNDNLGVRRSLLLGFSISALGYLLLATASSKKVVYATLFGILPLGNSMGIPMLTVGIRRYTNTDNRGFAFGLFYSVMNIAAFVSGFVVDFFNIAVAPGAGVNISGALWSGNRFVILTGVLTSTTSWTVTYLYLREIRVAGSCPSASPSALAPPSHSIGTAGDSTTPTSGTTSFNPLLQYDAVGGDTAGTRAQSGLAADHRSSVKNIPYPTHTRADVSPVVLSYSESAYSNVNISVNVDDDDEDMNSIKQDENGMDRMSTDSPNPAYARFTIEDSGSDAEDDTPDDAHPLPTSTSQRSASVSDATKMPEQSDTAAPAPTPAPTATTTAPQTGPFLYKETGPYFLEFEETPRSSRQGSDALAPKLSDKAVHVQVPPYFHPSPVVNRKSLIATALTGYTGGAIPVTVSHADTVTHAGQLRAHLPNNIHHSAGQGRTAEEQQHSDSSCTRQRDNSECELAHTRHRGASLWSYSGHDLGEEEVRVQMHGDGSSQLNSTSFSNTRANNNNKNSNSNSNSSSGSSSSSNSDSNNHCRLESGNNNNNTNNNSSSSSNYETHTQGAIQAFVPSPQSAWKTVSDLVSSRTFWRFSAFTLLLVNLKTVFRHLDATLPTYLVRMFGKNVPKGIIYSINPFMIIFLTPLVSALTSTTAHFDMIKYGSYITAVSPFFLAISTSIWATVCMVVVLSLGEAIWSPRCYDYTMSIAPEGREASFAALAAAPIFLAKVPVGLMSGYLVARYLPEHGHQDGRTLWLIIALLTMSSPIGITLFESCIREPTHLLIDQSLLLPVADADTDTDTEIGIKIEVEDDFNDSESKNEHEIKNKIKPLETCSLVSQA